MKRILCIILAFIVCFSYFNTLNAIKAEDKIKESVNYDSVIKELKDQRTEFSNTYLLPDGRIKKEIFLDDIRYKEDGDLYGYNNNLRKLTRKEISTLDDNYSYEYTNRSSDVNNYFPNVLTGREVITTKYKNYRFSMKPIIETKDQNNGFKSTVKDNQITYNTYDSRIQYQYVSLNKGIKENIILKDRPSTFIFKYEITKQNIYIKQIDGSRGLEIIDEKTDKTLGYLEVPFIKDASGQIDYENVRYKVQGENGNEIIMEINEDYFDENIKYPVVIDPTMVWQFGYISTTGIWSASFMQNSSLHTNPLTVSNNINNSYPYAGTEHRICLDTSNLTTGLALMGNGLSFDGEVIESATLNFYEATLPNYYPSGGTVTVKRALSSWTPSNVTWISQPSLSPIPVGQTICTGTLDEHHEIDLTDWVQGLADGDYDNYGLVLTCPNVYSSASIYSPEVNYIYGPNGSYQGVRHMSIVVIYRPYNEIKHINYSSGVVSYSLFDDYNSIKTIEPGYNLNNRSNSSLDVKGFQNRSILPGSSLTLVNPIQYPYSAVVALRFGADMDNFGTGFVIGPNTILTAAHCIKDEPFNVTAYFRKYNACTYAVTDAYYQAIYDCYSFDQNDYNDKGRYDWAIITVNGNIGESTGWLGFTNNLVPTNTPVEIVGYTKYSPLGYLYAEMLKSSGLTSIGDSNNDTNLYYSASTLSGQSGGPVLNSNYYVIGVHISDYDDSNRGRVIDDLMFGFAKQKKEEGVDLYEDD